MRERRDRVASLLRGAIAEIILKQASDPNLREVTITSCQVSKDLHKATLYFTTLGDEKRETELLRSLKRAKGFIKLNLSKKVRLKFMPEIEFSPDELLKADRRIGDTIRDES